MVDRSKDIQGKTFNFWTVISRAGKKGNCAAWLCRCKCGKEKIMAGSRLILGESMSCGCRPRAVTSHGHTSHNHVSKTYSSWKSIIARCTQPSNPAYSHYKSRGITICDRWRDFNNFLSDMGEKPEGDYTIDRIDNNGNYEPSNCRWATKLEQANNRITNIHFVWNGVKYTLAELSRASGVSKELLRCRLVRNNGKVNWTVDQAISCPKNSRRKDF